MKNLRHALARLWSRVPGVVAADPATAQRLQLLPVGGPLAAVPAPAAPPESFSKAGIVVVSYFGPAYLRQCLASELHRTAWPNFRVVVVDNGSDSATRDYLRGAAAGDPRLEAVFNGRNLGFAAANNVGLRRLDDCATLVLLNNDTIVPPGWLDNLVRHAAQPDVGLVGPVTNWTGNEARIDAAYDSIAGMEQFARAYTAAHADQLFDIAVPAMFCVAFRREVFQRVGELDEQYGAGMFEDADYAEAVRAQGWRAVCCEDAFVHHYGMASFSKLDQAAYRRLFERNREYFENKWSHPWTPHQARRAT